MRKPKPTVLDIRKAIEALRKVEMKPVNGMLIFKVTCPSGN